MKNCFLRTLMFFKFCRITEFDQTYKCLTSWSFGRFVILYFPGLLIKTNDANLNRPYPLDGSQLLTFIGIGVI